jgi:RimJ/RimL family protein N-acetyltransferase
MHVPSDPVTLAAETLTTARLRLDPLTVADAEPMAAVYADRRMFEFTGGEPPTRESLQRRYESLAVGRSPDGTESWLNWIVRTLDSPQVVGAMQATVAEASLRAWVAWEIGTAWQGRGFAGEAAPAIVAWLRERGVTSIEAKVHPDHAASQAVARRAGLALTDRVDNGEQVWAWPLDQPTR